jgi:hypothetical protein
MKGTYCEGNCRASDEHAFWMYAETYTVKSHHTGDLSLTDVAFCALQQNCIDSIGPSVPNSLFFKSNLPQKL